MRSRRTDPARRALLGAALGLLALIGCGPLRPLRSATATPTAVPTIPPTIAPSPLPSQTPTARATVAPSPTPRPPTATPQPPTPTPIATPTIVVRPTRTPVTPIVATPLPTFEPMAPPVWIDIPKIGVSAPIVQIGVMPDGAVEAPSGPREVGWVRVTPRPGEPGNSILTGHVDFRTETAVFWRLKELQPADKITITTQARQFDFTVETTESYLTEKAPLQQIVGYAVGRVITIITCEGIFNQTTRDYSHRRIVRARLV